jgi:hypothetical protein
LGSGPFTRCRGWWDDGVAERSPRGDLVIAAAGALAVWAVAFAVSYVLVALACVPAPASRAAAGREAVAVLGWLVTASSILAALAILIVSRWRRRESGSEPAEREQRAFSRQLATATAGLATLGTVWNAVALLSLPPCR